MSNVPNLDAMSFEELVLFNNRYRKATREKAFELIGDKRSGYTVIARRLAYYAREKANAINCRLMGEIAGALEYEAYCDKQYAQLPQDLRW